MRSGLPKPVPLLLWRAHVRSCSVLDESDVGKALPNLIRRVCPWCGRRTIVTEVSTREFEFLGNDDTRVDCSLCGWFARSDLFIDGESCESFSPWEERQTVAQLREFQYSDAAVAVAELGGYIRSNPDALEAVPPRRFESLTADLLAEHGYVVTLTQQTRDGGVDILAVDRSAQAPIVVQCKHSASRRTVGVSTLRELVGASILFETNRLLLATNSTFSVPLSDAATSYRSHGFEVGLRDGSDILRMLNVYEPTYPDLNVLSIRDLDEIAETNRRLLMREP